MSKKEGKKEENSYTHNRNKWGEFIKLAGIKEESIDKISDYVENHVRYELQSSMLKVGGYEESTLPLAINTLAKLDANGLLDKIVFVGAPKGEEEIDGIKYAVNCETIRYGFDFTKDNLSLLPDMESYVYNAFMTDTVKVLEKLINDEGMIFIFILFSKIASQDYKSMVFHRYCKPVKIEDEGEEER